MAGKPTKSAGAVNVVDVGREGGGLVNVSFEQVLQWNPDTMACSSVLPGSIRDGIRSETRGFYKLLYQVDMTDPELDRLLEGTR